MSHWMEQAELFNSHSQPDLNAPQAPQAAVPAPDKGPDATTIAQDMGVTGSVYGQGSVLVEGTVIGEIRVTGHVTVAKTGVVKGPIEGDVVSVAGAVEGDIAARTRLQLEMTGSILGDVTTCSFAIADGSYFNGRSHMTKPGEEPVFLY